MYAIIRSGSKQFWAVPGETIQVERLPSAVGEEISLDALWVAGDAAADFKGGTSLASAKVTARVLRHLRGPKIIVFKKRPKKAYQKTQGHRQNLTEILIQGVSPN